MYKQKKVYIHITEVSGSEDTFEDERSEDLTDFGVLKL